MQSTNKIDICLKKTILEFGEALQNIRIILQLFLQKKEIFCHILNGVDKGLSKCIIRYLHLLDKLWKY